MRLIVVSIMVTLLSGCGSIISRTIPGQGHGNQYYPGVQWDVRDSAWRYVTILDSAILPGFRYLTAADRHSSWPV